MVRARGVHPLGRPIVATVERCAEMLKLEPDRLAEAVQRAQVEVWGQDAHQQPVYRWGRLVELGQQLGGQLPAELSHSWRQYDKAKRGRAAAKSPATKRKAPT